MSAHSPILLPHRCSPPPPRWPQAEASPLHKFRRKKPRKRSSPPPPRLAAQARLPNTKKTRGARRSGSSPPPATRLSERDARGGFGEIIVQGPGQSVVVQTVHTRGRGGGHNEAWDLFRSSVGRSEKIGPKYAGECVRAISFSHLKIHMKGRKAMYGRARGECLLHFQLQGSVLFRVISR